MKISMICHIINLPKFRPSQLQRINKYSLHVYCMCTACVLHVFCVAVGAASYGVRLLHVQYREGADLVENEVETCHICAPHKMLRCPEVCTYVCTYGCMYVHVK